MYSNAFSADPSCSFVQIEKIIEKTSANWHICSEAMNVVLYPHRHIVIPDSSTADVTAFTNKQIPLLHCAFFNL